MPHPTRLLALVALSASPAYGVTVAVNSAAAWPAHVFSPYVDSTIYPTPQLGSIAAGSGNNFYTLAFLTADTSNTQQAAWGGYDSDPVAATSATNGSTDFGYNLITGVNAVRAAGGDVMASFGGAAGTPIDSTITNAAALAAQYQQVISTYKLNAIDFDVEGKWASDAASIARRSAAIATVEADDPGLKVWFTLPVTTSGLPSAEQNVLKSGLAAGDRIDGVNVLAMDYYDGVSGTQMGAAAISAATATHAQLKALFAQHGQTYTDAQLWGMQGVTPMVGINDDTSEDFTPANAQQVLTFAQQNGLGELSFWEATRDHPGSGAVNETNSSTAQSDYQYAKLFAAYNAAAPAVWAVAGGGSWGTAGNWGGTVPNAAGAVATLGPALTAPGTVTLDGSRTVGRLTFGGTSSYTVTAGTGGTLTLNDTAGSPGITVTAGTHTVAAPVVLAAGATITTAAGTGLTLGGAVTGSGTLAVAGAGTTTFSTTATVAVPVSVSGSLTFAANVGSTALVRSLPGGLAVTTGGTATIAAGVQRTLLVPATLSVAGRLDVGADDVDVPNGNLAAITALAATAFAGGAWTGPGITSSTAAASAGHLTAVGVILNDAGSSPLYATLDGRAAAATDVLVRYTDYGDADLSGTVTAADYLRVDAGFIGHLTGWANGDFNYDGVVDGSDYTLIDNAFDQQSAATARPAVLVATELASVPEPAGMAVVVAVGLVLRRRRRHSV